MAAPDERFFRTRFLPHPPPFGFRSDLLLAAGPRPAAGARRSLCSLWRGALPRRDSPLRFRGVRSREQIRSAGWQLIVFHPVDELRVCQRQILLGEVRSVLRRIALEQDEIDR